MLVFKAFYAPPRSFLAGCWGSLMSLLCSPSEQHTARGSESTDVAFERKMVCFSCIKSSRCLPREACARSRDGFINTRLCPCPSRSVPAAGSSPCAQSCGCSCQDPAASWRGSSACSQCGGGGCMAGSQRGRDHRDHSVAVGTSAVTGLGDNGNHRQQSCCPAWQLGTLPTGPSGILRWPKPQCPFFLLGAEHSDTAQLPPGLGHVTTPEPGASPELGAALWAVEQGWLILSRALSAAKPWPHPGHPTGASRRDRL